MALWGQHNRAEVQQCRKKISSTVPKMKTLFNSAKNVNKFQHIKCGNQKLNGKRNNLKRHLKVGGGGGGNLQFRRFGAKIVV